MCREFGVTFLAHPEFWLGVIIGLLLNIKISQAGVNGVEVMG